MMIANSNSDSNSNATSNYCTDRFLKHFMNAMAFAGVELYVITMYRRVFYNQCFRYWL